MDENNPFMNIPLLEPEYFPTRNTLRSECGRLHRLYWGLSMAEARENNRKRWLLEDLLISLP